MNLTKNVTSNPATEAIIADYYGGWYHRYRTIEQIIKLENCDASRASLLIKLFRSKYQTWK